MAQRDAAELVDAIHLILDPTFSPTLYRGVPSTKI